MASGQRPPSSGSRNVLRHASGSCSLFGRSHEGSRVKQYHSQITRAVARVESYLRKHLTEEDLVSVSGVAAEKKLCDQLDHIHVLAVTYWPQPVKNDYRYECTMKYI